MTRWSKLFVLAVAVAVAAVGGAWWTGVFDRSPAPEGMIAQDSVTTVVGGGGGQLVTVGVVALVAVAVAAVWVLRRRRQGGDRLPADWR